MSGPLYRAIAASIEARISAGKYGPDEPLPPEPLLEQEFGVSRITIRRALGQLKQKGLLHSRSGMGTLVRAEALNSDAMRVTGSIEGLSYYAAKTRYVPIDCRYVKAKSDIATQLGIAIGERVLYMNGNRGNGAETPFAFEELYVPSQFSKGISNAKLDGRTVFSIIEDLHGVAIAQVRQAVTAVMPTSKARRVLGLSKRQCCLKGVRLYLGRNNRPVELSVTYYDSTRFEYTTTLYAD
jgi:DNA-binding GntR family transcriptional regulator